MIYCGSLNKSVMSSWCQRGSTDYFACLQAKVEDLTHVQSMEITFAQKTQHGSPGQMTTWEDVDILTF